MLRQKKNHGYPLGYGVELIARGTSTPERKFIRPSKSRKTVTNHSCLSGPTGTDILQNTLRVPLQISKLDAALSLRLIWELSPGRQRPSYTTSIQRVHKNLHPFRWNLKWLFVRLRRTFATSLGLKTRLQESVLSATS
jgi:hypothetical protein